MEDPAGEGSGGVELLSRAREDPGFPGAIITGTAGRATGIDGERFLSPAMISQTSLFRAQNAASATSRRFRIDRPQDYAVAGRRPVYQDQNHSVQSRRDGGNG